MPQEMMDGGKLKAKRRKKEFVRLVTYSDSEKQTDKETSHRNSTDDEHLQEARWTRKRRRILASNPRVAPPLIPLLNTETRRIPPHSNPNNSTTWHIFIDGLYLKAHHYISCL